jgi:hypothetical protein
MAQEAFVLVKAVLTAPETLGVLELWMAEEATVLIPVVLGAPQPPWFSQLGIANEASIQGSTVLCAKLTTIVAVLVS